MEEEKTQANQAMHEIVRRMLAGDFVSIQQYLADAANQGFTLQPGDTMITLICRRHPGMPLAMMALWLLLIANGKPAQEATAEASRAFYVLFGPIAQPQPTAPAEPTPAVPSSGEPLKTLIQ